MNDRSVNMDPLPSSDMVAADNDAYTSPHHFPSSSMIPFSDVNLVAVILATLVRIAIGFAWYLPAVFGTTWMTLVGIDPKKAEGDMKRAMTIGFASSFIGTYALGLVVEILLPQTLMETIALTLILWLAFVMPLALSRTAWENSSWTLFWINGMQELVSLLAASAILYGMM